MDDMFIFDMGPDAADEAIAREDAEVQDTLDEVYEAAEAFDALLAAEEAEDAQEAEVFGPYPAEDVAAVIEAALADLEAELEAEAANRAFEAAVNAIRVEAVMERVGEVAEALEDAEVTLEVTARAVDAIDPNGDPALALVVINAFADAWVDRLEQVAELTKLVVGELDNLMERIAARV